MDARILRMRLAAMMLLAATASATAAVAQDVDILEIEKWYALEETAFAYGLGAERAVGEAARCMEADNARWRAAVGQVCIGETCREAALRDRIATLHGLQPPARQTQMDLPEVPELLVVIAPEDDEARTPKDFTAALPFSVTGTLAQEYEDIDRTGLVLRAENGGMPLLVPLMELGDQASHAVLVELLVEHPEQRYKVRGGRDPVEDAAANFRADQCRFVYRMPE